MVHDYLKGNITECHSDSFLIRVQSSVGKSIDPLISSCIKMMKLWIL